MELWGDLGGKEPVKGTTVHSLPPPSSEDEWFGIVTAPGIAMRPREFGQAADLKSPTGQRSSSGYELDIYNRAARGQGGDFKYRDPPTQSYRNTTYAPYTLASGSQPA